MAMKRALSLAGLLVLSLALAAPAQASFHLLKISEVFPGTPAAFDKAFIELRMVASGQNLLTGHSVVVYDALGAPVSTVVMNHAVPNAENNRAILLGDIDVVNRDFDANIGTLVNPAGGAVCIPDAAPVDCVAWGSFSAPGALPGAVGTPVAPGGIPASGTTASALVRSTARGCPTFLEPLDDTDDSAADFSVVDAETPESNASPIGTAPCLDAAAPQTTITRKPPRRTSKRRVKFEFKSTEPGSTFRCAFDRGPFKPCASPLAKRLPPGRHRFRAAAVDSAGNVDPTPASARVRVRRHRR